MCNQLLVNTDDYNVHQRARILAVQLPVDIQRIVAATRRCNESLQAPKRNQRMDESALNSRTCSTVPVLLVRETLLLSAVPVRETLMLARAH